MLLTQQSEGVMVAVPSQKVTAISWKLIYNPIKSVNMMSSEKTASPSYACHTSWTQQYPMSMKIAMFNIKCRLFYGK